MVIQRGTIGAIVIHEVDGDPTAANGHTANYDLPLSLSDPKYFAI
jgi:hypothetical protein